MKAFNAFCSALTSGDIMHRVIFNLHFVYKRLQLFNGLL